MGAVPLAVPDANDPSLVRDLPVPSNFQVFTSPQGVSATWDAGKSPAMKHENIRLTLYSVRRVQLRHSGVH